MYKLNKLEAICEKYDLDPNYNVNPAQFKKVIEEVGPINWSKFMATQKLNMTSPGALDESKFPNFTDVADPHSKVNLAIFKDCLEITQKLSDGTFQSFKSRDVAWGFIHFILAYLQDTDVE